MPRKVTVDALACEGHGRCQNNAPEVFQLDADDISRVQLDEIPDALVAKVERAIRTCPRQAITWVEG
ncbi:MAG: ferredoxin [Chloroflexi bacterium]|nr:ferredoxin [Chloroflexota bacterium]MDA1002752.1 ferredoxin [Chloroflexota bacterium]